MESHLTLAITTLGDVLMNSRLTRNVSSGQAIDGVLLHIPEYQRPYKWTVKNANLLLSDILEAMNEKHQVYRVGTLILHKNNKFYDIVDGQQRIITFLLLLHAFSIHSNLQKFRLSDSPVTRYNLQQNYYSLKRQVDNISDIQKKELNDYIMHHCELIVVITYELSEAFQFFDSQNARGKSLYPHDLLKAYHLREMSGFKESEIESTVCSWESMDQNLLYRLFGDYLYRIKQWLYDRRAYELNDQNLDIFKGITKTQNEPYAQFYKRAIDSSNERLFLLEAPIVAGKPFFDYSKHYYDVLADIRNKSHYEGCFVDGNNIIQTLELRHLKHGVGNTITRLMFDLAILLFVDRFCHRNSTTQELKLLDNYILFAFIWAYSMRAQYFNVGWLVAQNYILGYSSSYITNAFNLYKLVLEAYSASDVLSKLSAKLVPIKESKVVANKENIDDSANGVYRNYLHYFYHYNFIVKENE